MNWRPHNGNACPTDEKALVRLRYRGAGEPFESRNEYPAGRLRWSHKGEASDIIAYVVTSVPQEDE